jgi:hypothetical protein
MKQTIEIKVPKDWSAVTLKDYLELQKDLVSYKDEPEALVACLFHHLCNFPVEHLQKLDVDTYTAISNELNIFINKNDYSLQKFITIDGIEYAFEPDLSKIAYGAYVDISKYQNIGIDENWANIMSILYRPVISKSKTLYEIEPYKGNIDGDKFMDVSMDVHFGAVFFFNNLLKELLSSTLSYLGTQTTHHQIPPNIKLILEKSGNLIHRLSNSQMETSLNLKK